MSLNINESRDAYADTIDIATYLAENAYIELIDRFLVAVRTAYGQLADMPNIGASRDYGLRRYRGMRIYSVPDFPNYLIHYRPLETEIEILRVLHGARNIKAILRRRL